MSHPILRFAAIVGSPYPKRWEIQVLARLAQSGLAEPVAIWAARAETRHTALERLCLRRAERWALALAPMAAPDQTLGLPVVALDDPGQGSATVAGDLDFVVDFSGAGPALARSPRFGRWILRIGAGSSGAVAGTLTAFCSGAPAVEVELVCQDAAGSERVLYAGRLAQRATFARTLDNVLLSVADWYEVACRMLLLGQQGSAAAPARERAPAGLAAFLAASARRWLLATRQRHSVEIWNVGIAPRPSFEALAQGGVLAGVSWLPEPPALAFRADPFGWIDALGRTCIAHERFDYGAGKGTLEVARLKSGGTDAPSFEPLADLPVHASYPYLMPAGGMLLCLPEVNETGRTLLFKIEEEPLRLTYVKTLLEDVPMSDGTIFRFGAHHWLLGTRADRDAQLRLYAWFASAIDGPWTPHPLNPVKCDITSARPAGTPFWAGGSLIRPAQDCSRSYGGAIALNRVLELTPTSFREETVARIVPDPRGPYPDGIHTLSFVGDSILIDGKRHVLRRDGAALNRNFPQRRYERQLRLRAGAGGSRE